VTVGDAKSLAARKKTLRAELRRVRQEQGCAVGSVESQCLAEKAAEQAFGLGALAVAKCVAVYAASGHELDPACLVERLAVSSSVAFPRIETAKPPALSFRLCSPSALVAARFGLREPLETAPSVQAIDVFVVPGLGFDPKGRRLGQGGGYYDAALHKVPEAVRVGFGYDFQIISEIPVEECDEPMDFIVTPTRTWATLARTFAPRSAKEDVS
jgi:5-formyltetrahydrofolate cyclo-ligase